MEPGRPTAETFFLPSFVEKVANVDVSRSHCSSFSRASKISNLIAFGCIS